MQLNSAKIYNENFTLIGAGIVIAIIIIISGLMVSL
jgi:hypothetical protein